MSRSPRRSYLQPRQTIDYRRALSGGYRLSVFCQRRKRQLLLCQYLWRAYSKLRSSRYPHLLISCKSGRFVISVLSRGFLFQNRIPFVFLSLKNFYPLINFPRGPFSTVRDILYPLPCRFRSVHKIFQNFWYNKTNAGFLESSRQNLTKMQFDFSFYAYYHFVEFFGTY